MRCVTQFLKKKNLNTDILLDAQDNAVERTYCFSVVPVPSREYFVEFVLVDVEWPLDHNEADRLSQLTSSKLLTDNP